MINTCSSGKSINVFADMSMHSLLKVFKVAYMHVLCIPILFSDICSGEGGQCDSSIFRELSRPFLSQVGHRCQWYTLKTYTCMYIIITCMQVCIHADYEYMPPMCVKTIANCVFLVERVSIL